VPVNIPGARKDKKTMKQYDAAVKKYPMLGHLYLLLKKFIVLFFLRKEVMNLMSG
jgi:hypothetical protein